MNVSNTYYLIFESEIICEFNKKPTVAEVKDACSQRKIDMVDLSAEGMFFLLKTVCTYEIKESNSFTLKEIK